MVVDENSETIVDITPANDLVTILDRESVKDSGLELLNKSKSRFNLYPSSIEFYSNKSDDLKKIIDASGEYAGKLFYYGLPAVFPFLEKSLSWSHVVESLPKIALASKRNLWIVFNEGLPALDKAGLLNDDLFPYFVNFIVKEVRDSKNKVKQLKNISYLDKRHCDLAKYLLMYRPGQFLDCVENLRAINYLNLDVRKLYDFLGSVKPLVFYDKDNLLKLMSPSKRGSVIERNYLFLTRYLGKKSNIDKLVNEEKKVLSHFSRNSDYSDKRYISSLEKIDNMFAFLISDFVDKKIVSSIKKKIKSKLRVYDKSKIDDLFIESFKMELGTEFNKLQARELLKEYVLGNTYPSKSVFDCYPYTSRKNMLWIDIVLGSDAELWFKENEQEFVMKKENLQFNAKYQFEHYWKESKRICKNLGIVCPKNFFDLENLLVQLKEKNNSLVADLKCQIKGIRSYLGDSNSFGSVKIYHELNPLKVLMMGNWVHDSCLATDSYNPWSAFANAVDANKAVFYISSEDKIVGRVLVALSDDRKLFRFPMYYSKQTFDLNPVFNKYLADLADKCNLTVSKKQIINDIKLLLADEWYSDPVEK